MTPAEAAAFRKGLEAGARAVDDEADAEQMRASVRVGGEPPNLRDMAAAIRALPVPDDAPAECPTCQGSGMRFYCGDFDDCPECGGTGATDAAAPPVPQGGEATDVDWAERYRLVCFELCELMGIKADEIIADSGEEAWMLVGYEARTKQAAALRARRRS